MARGNAVMKAKRTTGASADYALRTVVMGTLRCSVDGCDSYPVISLNRHGLDRARYCLTHHGRYREDRAGTVAVARMIVANSQRSFRPW